MFLGRMKFKKIRVKESATDDQIRLLMKMYPEATILKGSQLIESSKSIGIDGKGTNITYGAVKYEEE